MRATYSVNLSNVGAGPTSGTVTVTNIATQGLTLVAMTGTGWACVMNVCTRGDALAGGEAYPPINVTVEVTGNPGPVTNLFTVSGGGFPSYNGSYPATINYGPTVFGSFDTPADFWIGTGTVSLTGWALSSAGIASVWVWRDAIGNEPVAENGLVSIGPATIVPGIRPDVASAFPGYPGNNAGWGLQLLTNELPDSGNGVYHIHAIATDNDYRSVELAVKTLSADNSVAVAPFGTIDTPAPGATVSGSAYVNFGWELTPNPATVIPKDGSTIVDYIDNAPVGHPVYNNYRVDIATLFPGLQNSDGAVGYYVLDTTKLSNGLHTIAWLVTDSAGNLEGTGSRYFYVQN